MVTRILQEGNGLSEKRGLVRYVKGGDGLAFLDAKRRGGAWRECRHGDRTGSPALFTACACALMAQPIGVVSTAEMKPDSQASSTWVAPGLWKVGC